MSIVDLRLADLPTFDPEAIAYARPPARRSGRAPQYAG
jgi:hypothetical protein